MELSGMDPGLAQWMVVVAFFAIGWIAKWCYDATALSRAWRRMWERPTAALRSYMARHAHLFGLDREEVQEDIWEEHPALRRQLDSLTKQNKRAPGQAA